jgi:hypothetical protein
MTESEKLYEILSEFAIKKNIGIFEAVVLFSNENTSTLTSTISACSSKTSFHSSTVGYACGGNTGSRISTISKMTFSTEATATVTSTLTSAKQSGNGFNSTTIGYYCGGDTNSYITTINKLLFSNESISNVTSGLTEVWAAGASCDYNP